LVDSTNKCNRYNPLFVKCKNTVLYKISSASLINNDYVFSPHWITNSTTHPLKAGGLTISELNRRLKENTTESQAL